MTNSSVWLLLKLFLSISSLHWTLYIIYMDISEVIIILLSTIHNLSINLTLGFKFLFRGFTKFNRTDYLKFKSENRIMPDGVNAKVMWSCLIMQCAVIDTVYLVDFIMLRMLLHDYFDLRDCVELCFWMRFSLYRKLVIISARNGPSELNVLFCDFAASWVPWTIG